MIHNSFHIQAPGIYFPASSLLIEAGPGTLSLLVVDDKNFFSAITAYSFSLDNDSETLADKWGEIFNNEILCQQSYKKVIVVWSFPESVLLPNESIHAASAGNEMLDLLYGNLQQSNIKKDFLYKYNIHHIYRIPAIIDKVVFSKFPFAIQTHQFSLLPDVVPKQDNRLLVIFYTNRASVLLHREGIVQIVQQFSFSNEDDALYHLLSICNNFDVQVKSVILHISGMVDVDSKIYTGLYKYFLHIQWLPLPDKFTCADEIQKQPEHFFSHLFSFAACV